MGSRIAFAKPGPADLEEERALDAACERVIRSNAYILGTEVGDFEEEWSNYVGANGAVGVASGLDALESGLRCVGVGPGDEVIVPAMSAMATALAVARCGATPVFCDIDADTALIDLGQARGLVTDRTHAVVPVHLYGRAVDMPALLDWSGSVGLAVVEDAAQAHGARIGGRLIGTWGDATAFSFYPTKNLGALGDGGALTSMSATLLDEARTLRNYGQRGLYQHEVVGLNSRLDEMQAAILRVRLARLDERTVARQAVADRYFRELENPAVRLLARPEAHDEYVAHLFVVTTDDRPAFIDFMAAKGIDCLVHYPKALPDQPAARHWGSKHDVPRARAHAATCVSLPCRPGLSDAEVARVIEAVNGYQP